MFFTSDLFATEIHLDFDLIFLDLFMSDALVSSLPDIVFAILVILLHIARLTDAIGIMRTVQMPTYVGLSFLAPRVIAVVAHVSRNFVFVRVRAFRSCFFTFPIIIVMIWVC